MKDCSSCKFEKQEIILIKYKPIDYEVSIPELDANTD